MSSPDPRPVELSPRARQDFVDILRYTGEIWGQQQMLAYRDKINDALQALGKTRNWATAATICRRAFWPILSAHTSSSTDLARRTSASRVSCISA